MSTIKNLVAGIIYSAAVGAATIIGFGIGTTLLENGLQEKVAEKAQKWFSK